MRGAVNDQYLPPVLIGETLFGRKLPKFSNEAQTFSPPKCMAKVNRKGLDKPSRERNSITDIPQSPSGFWKIMKWTPLVGPLGPIS